MFGTENPYQYIQMHREAVDTNTNKYGVFGKWWSLHKFFSADVFIHLLAKYIVINIYGRTEK
jgi:hypothetical protein